MASALYRHILKSAKHFPPPSHIQASRLWLSYNAKNLIYSYKDVKDTAQLKTLVEQGYQDIQVIVKLWSTPKFSKFADKAKYAYNVPLSITGDRNWLPGFAVKHWLKEHAG